LTGLTQAQVQNLLQNIDTRTASIPSPPSTSSSNQQGAGINTGTNQNVGTDRQVNLPPPTTRPEVPEQRNQPQAARPSTGNTSRQLNFEPGIRFRVQIAAGRTEVNIPQHFRNFRLEQLPLIEQNDGWFKYITPNSFADYQSARNLRVQISNTTAVVDPFVVAYNDSRRITVQEALMATNQPWVR
jgi:hypothetical protein